MQNLLQTVQLQFKIYNPEIEPEHDTDYPCNCAVHNYQRLKYNRLPVQKKWSEAVMYPGQFPSRPGARLFAIVRLTLLQGRKRTTTAMCMETPSSPAIRTSFVLCPHMDSFRITGGCRDHNQALMQG